MDHRNKNIQNNVYDHVVWLIIITRFSLHLANGFYPRVLWFCFSFIPWDVWNWMLFLPVPELDFFFSFYPPVIQSPAFPVCHSLFLLHYIFLSVSSFLFCITSSCLSRSLLHHIFLSVSPFYSASHLPICLSLSFLHHIFLSVSPFLFCITFSCLSLSLFLLHHIFLSLPFSSALHFPVCLSPSFLYHLILSHNIQYSTVCLTVTHTHYIHIYGAGGGGGGGGGYMTDKLDSFSLWTVSSVFS